MVERGSFGAMITVFLVRHGESQANAGFATSDPVKVELTPLGKKQAIEVATFFEESKQPTLKLIVYSPFLRTKQTAEPTKALFRHAAVEEWEVQEFTYLSSIHRVCSTVQDRKPLVDGYWTKSEPSLWEDFYPTFISSTHSESFKVFIWRVQAFIRKLKELDDKCQNIAVFSHEQFIAAVLWCIEREGEEITSDSMRDFRDFFKKHRLPNGGLVKLRVRHSQVVRQSSVITDHLQHKVPEPEPPVRLEPELAGVC
jgi:probable phosphoglycerate mutase